jgi:hypothetical protein
VEVFKIKRPLNCSLILCLAVGLFAFTPKVDAGDPASCPVTDQYMLFRPADGNAVHGAVCDIGAVEYGPILGFIPLI